MSLHSIYKILENEISAQESAKSFLANYFKNFHLDVKGCGLELSPSYDILFEYGVFSSSINFVTFYEWSKSSNEVNIETFEAYLMAWIEAQIK